MRGVAPFLSHQFGGWQTEASRKYSKSQGLIESRKYNIGIISANIDITDLNKMGYGRIDAIAAEISSLTSGSFSSICARSRDEFVPS